MRRAATRLAVRLTEASAGGGSGGAAAGGAAARALGGAPSGARHLSYASPGGGAGSGGAPRRVARTGGGGGNGGGGGAAGAAGAGGPGAPSLMEMGREVAGGSKPLQSWERWYWGVGVGGVSLWLFWRLKPESKPADQAEVGWGLGGLRAAARPPLEPRGARRPTRS
jgi:hypothetical protein